jgi:hypothetical protein
MRGVLAFGLLACLVGAAQAQKAAVPVDFDVDVTLSKLAADKLAAAKEKIIVAAYWGGEPTEKASKHAEGDGQISLGAERVTISGAGGRAHIKGSTFERAHIGWVKDGALEVLVNVYSARLSSGNNLLDCGLFQDSPAKSREKPVNISCKLIGEK